MTEGVGVFGCGVALARFGTQKADGPHVSGSYECRPAFKELGLSSSLIFRVGHCTMSQQIRTVAVVGCGVIGMSWATLFLAHGLKIIVSDPLRGAEDAFQSYVRQAWPVLGTNKDLEKMLRDNYEFVTDLSPRLPEVDFIQEVHTSYQAQPK